MFNGKYIFCSGPFAIAMLVYRSVNIPEDPCVIYYTMTMDPMGISISLYKPMDKQKDIYLTHVFREKSIKLSPPLIFNVPQIAATKKQQLRDHT